MTKDEVLMMARDRFREIESELLTRATRPCSTKERESLWQQAHKHADLAEQCESARSLPVPPPQFDPDAVIEACAKFIERYGPSDDVGNYDSAEALRSLKGKFTVTKAEQDT